MTEYSIAKTYGTMQENVLEDRKNGKKPANWRKHKKNSLLLGESYRRLTDVNKAFRVTTCGSYLEFKRHNDGTLKLHDANFCKVRLCPMCAWRRSIKVYGQTSKIMDYLEESKEYRYIFVTLTVKNVSGEELSSELDKLFAAYKKMTERREFKRVSKGWFRCLEVTHNWETNEYHPHIHVIITVNKSYFSSQNYLSHDAWMALWRSCAGLDYDPWVDVRTVKPDPDSSGEEIKHKKAVSEVAKYTVKASDFIVEVPAGATEKVKQYLHSQMDEVVDVLDKALAGRRLVAYGGLMREVHKKLNLDEPTEGDLINTDNDEQIRPDLGYVIERYEWHIGYGNYVLVDAAVE